MLKMAFLRNCINIKAESVLESVIALSIISICLYISILVYASVFSSKTSSKYYVARNKISSIYYLSQVEEDSLEQVDDANLLIEKEWVTPSLQKINIAYKDTLLAPISFNFFIAH